MRTGDKGINLIKMFEGLRLRAYLCPANKWTIGYGHTGPDVTPSLIISESEAETLLRKDIRTTETYLNKWAQANGVTLSQNQFDALISFIFNIGIGNFTRSTMAKKLIKGDSTASSEFPKWRLAGGKVSPGLERRRAAEKELFLS